jgi:hypothetical protein
MHAFFIYHAQFWLPKIVGPFCLFKKVNKDEQESRVYFPYRNFVKGNLDSLSFNWNKPTEEKMEKRLKL